MGFECVDSTDCDWDTAPLNGCANSILRPGSVKHTGEGAKDYQRSNTESGPVDASVGGGDEQHDLGLAAALAVQQRNVVLEQLHAGYDRLLQNRFESNSTARDHAGSAELRTPRSSSISLSWMLYSVDSSVTDRNEPRTNLDNPIEARRAAVSATRNGNATKCAPGNEATRQPGIRAALVLARGRLFEYEGRPKLARFNAAVAARAGASRGSVS